MPPDPGAVVSVADAFARSGVDLGALGLAWARVAPAVAIVPAFGLRALPVPGRALLAVALGASVFPALAPVAEASSAPWALLAVREAALGLPVAVAAAIPLWAATMAGGIPDAIRGAREVPSLAVVEGGATPLGVLLSLLASAIFLASGGPSRVVAALIARPLEDHPIVAAADHLAAGIGLAVALAGPLLAAAVVVELAAALIARAASPAQVLALLAPLRALGTLAVLAVVIERLAATLGRIVTAAP